MSDVIERDFDWAAAVEPDLVLDNLRAAVFGDIPSYVLTSDNRRAKAGDLGKIKDELAKAMTDGDGRNMVGYSVVFNQWAKIRDREGEYMERIAAGATAKSIKERGDRIVVQFDHGTHPLIGSLPVAAPRALWEDDHGLFGWDRMHQSWLFEPVREAIASGAIKGQSFRFTIPDGGETWEKPRAGGLARRTITQTAIAERGAVVWPAYEGTDVAVRSLLRAMPQDLRRAVLLDADRNSVHTPAMIPDEGTDEPAAHVGTDEPAAARFEPAQGVTRQEMRLRALSLLGDTHDADRGAA
jgi:HK97 family phage prohead protease